MLLARQMKLIKQALFGKKMKLNKGVVVVTFDSVFLLINNHIFLPF